MLKKLRAIYLFGPGGWETQAGPDGQEDAELSPGSILWLIPVEIYVGPLCTVSPGTTGALQTSGAGKRVQQVLYGSNKESRLSPVPLTPQSS